jgi:Flp pilus assembly protein TadD
MPACNDLRCVGLGRAALCAAALLFASATALAGRKKVEEPPKPPVETAGVHASETGFTVIPAAPVDAVTRADYARASELLGKQRYTEGIAILEAILAQQPALTAAHVDLGIARAHAGELDRAEASLQRALELEPRHPIAWNELGLVQRRQGKFAAARASYEKALAAAPSFHVARLNLGVLCDLYLADAGCALDNYLAYQQVVPDDKRVAGWVANARARAGNQEK